MLLRRKLCVGVVIAAILFLMLASQSIQKSHFLPLSLAISWATPTGRETVVEPTAPPAALTPDPPGTPPPPPRSARPEAEQKPAEDSPDDPRSCGCAESCISDLGKSDWFSRRYDAGQQPVLRDVDDNFDPEALRWWLVRTKSKRCRIHYRSKVWGHRENVVFSMKTDTFIY
ncbi:hypothetical protein EYF80_062910 [Liparis tanakae]|uniref:Uncharacterized protein n=1 Tax=Liparis tanakae TaxID=230148 RepID=A0A4Z2EDM6_9TELE|nr:hypothetical protein EYF80_062910 [Liparis tanakae]